MPTALGAGNPRIAATRALLAKDGRAAAGRYAFEGETLLAEAARSGVALDEIFVTPERYAASDLVRRFEADGTPVYLVEPRLIRRISDVETPSGIVATTAIPRRSAAELLAEGGLGLLLADVSDPTNVGTLLRSAEAFGITSAIFGDRGADPYLPKVVRGAMGAHFRLRLAVAGPEALDGYGEPVIGLEAGGTPLDAEPWPRACLLAVGNERHGLGRFRDRCTALRAIPMDGAAESLNAAVAGSIALYEASKPLKAAAEHA